MSTGGPSDPVRRTRIRWGTGGGAIGLVVGVIGGLLAGGNLTVLGVGAVGAVAAVAGVVLTATGQGMAHSDRRYTRAKDEMDRLERAESRARARDEAHQQVRDDAAAVVLEAFEGGGRTDNVFVHASWTKACASGGMHVTDQSGPTGYAPFSPPALAEQSFFFNADPTILAAAKAKMVRDPCGAPPHPAPRLA